MERRERADRSATFHTLLAAIPGCGGAVRGAQRFCTACGRPFASPEAIPAPPHVPEGAPLPRPSRRVAGASAWRRFVPALQLWVGMLAINLVLGIGGHVADLSSPWFDVAASLAGAALVVAFGWRDRRELLPLLRRSGFDDRIHWQPLAATAALAAFLVGCFALCERLGFDTEPLLDDHRAHGWAPGWSLVWFSAVPAVVEELAFRGFVQRRLAAATGPRDAVLVQAAMFAVLHMNPVVFVSHFVFGAVLGAIRQACGSLWPGIVFHALWNAWVLLPELRTA